MDTAETSLGINGNKLYQKRARLALPILVRQAKADTIISYQDLAEEINMPNARNLNYPLGSIGTSLKELSEKWGEAIPQIQCIVVNQHTGLPGEGIGWFISDINEFKKLNRKQQKVLVDAELANIFAYPKWDLVLKTLGLKPAPISESIIKKVRTAATTKARGGEGPQHRKLKNFIKSHPACVGINLKNIVSETEKDLPSGDSIDVSFENKNVWIGVEVKSEISNETDILRGLYQCVKYQAVMESYLFVSNSQKDVEVILALGCGLPRELISVRNSLGIKVIENVK